jgi:type VI secretion system protein ImpB
LARESIQKKLGRDRAPRVQITYDVEVGDSLETKELPFVLGVLGDYAGHPAQPLPRLKDRSFVTVDTETFDEVLKGMAPRLALKVEDRLAGGDRELGVVLEFRSMEDFEPAGLVRQVPALARLLEARTRLSDLRNKMVGNDRLEALLEDVIRDTDRLKALAGREE